MCRSRRELFEQIANSNEYLLAKFGSDTAENEPCKVCPNIAVEHVSGIVLSAAAASRGGAPPSRPEKGARLVGGGLRGPGPGGCHFGAESQIIATVFAFGGKL